MKPLTLVLALGATAMVGVAGATLYTGYQIQHKLDAVAGSMSQYPLLKTVSRTTQRGVWTSEETVTYQLGCEAQFDSAMFGGNRPTLTLKHTAHHNPFQPGIDTEIIWPAEAKPVLQKLFGERTPLTMQTRAGWWGDYETRLNSPGFSLREQGNSVDWKGLDITLRFDGALSHMNSQITLGATEVQDAGGQFRLAVLPVRYQGQHQRSASGLLLGKENLVADGLNLSMQYLGQTHVIAAGTLQSETESSEQGGLVSLRSQGKLASLSYNNHTLGSLASKLGVQQLDAATLATYNRQSLQNGFLQCNFSNDLLQPANRALLLQLLSRNPAISAMLDLAHPTGHATLDVRASLNGATAADLDGDGTGLLPKLDAQAAVKWPQTLPERWIEEFVPQAEQASLLASYRMLLAELLQSGKVVREGQLLATRVSWKNGQVLQNGQPMGPFTSPAPTAVEPALPAPDLTDATPG